MDGPESLRVKPKMKHVDRPFQNCGTPFSARPVLADPNRVQDALLSLNHSKSYLWGSDFKIGQAHKHLTKYIYNEGILCLFKMVYKIDIQSSKCFYKISKFKKKHDMNVQVGAYSAIPSL